MKIKSLIILYLVIIGILDGSIIFGLLDSYIDKGGIYLSYNNKVYLYFFLAFASIPCIYIFFKYLSLFFDFLEKFMREGFKKSAPYLAFIIFLLLIGLIIFNLSNIFLSFFGIFGVILTITLILVVIEHFMNKT